MMREVPISSLDAVPATAETRAKLIERGVDLALAGPLSEVSAQALLDLTDDEARRAAPRCFGRYRAHYALCAGCAYKPHCQGNTTMEPKKTPPPPPHKGKKPRPAPPPPPKRVKKAPPPPPPRKPKKKTLDLAAGMMKLGFTTEQVQRSTAETRARIVREQIRNEGVSISKRGELRFVGGGR